MSSAVATSSPSGTAMCMWAGLVCSSAILLTMCNRAEGLRLYNSDGVAAAPDNGGGSGDYGDEISSAINAHPTGGGGRSLMGQAAAPPPPQSLQMNINEFIELLPVGEVQAKITEYYRNDADVQHIVSFANGKEFWTMKKNLIEVPEVKELETFFQHIGVNIKETLNKFDDLLGISKIRQLHQCKSGKLQTHPPGVCVCGVLFF